MVAVGVLEVVGVIVAAAPVVAVMLGETPVTVDTNAFAPGV